MSVAATVWSPQAGEGEYAPQTADTLVDENSNTIVDPSDSTIAIVSSTTSFTGVAATTWTEDEGS